MKRITLFIMILLCMTVFPCTSHAYWYIVSNSGKVVARADYEPSITDITSRGEIAVCSEKLIPLSKAVYDNGEIKKYKKTPQEISAEVKREERATEERFIREEMRKMAIERLKEKEHKFRYIE